MDPSRHNMLLIARPVEQVRLFRFWPDQFLGVSIDTCFSQVDTYSEHV